MSGWWLLIAFGVLTVMGIPIAFSLGASCVAFFVLNGIPLSTMPRIMMSLYETFPFLAIPFFALAGQLMNLGGITVRIFDFAKTVAGHIPGGLAHANVVASMIFAGMSGSAVADSAGLGTIEIQAMREDGYDPDFSAAITAASSTVGPIIPPSIPFVLYGAMANVSVGALFLAGAIPGILMGLSLMAVVYVIALKRGYGVCEKPTFHGALRSFMYAVPALATPVLILGGIVLGVCTPTEAAVIAVLYALFLGLIVYREMTPRDVLRIIGRVARTVGMVALLSCTATVFGWILTYEGIPQAIAQAMTSISPNRYVLLLIINLLLLLVGCFMDTTPALIVLVPILLPMITAFGIDRVHFGVVMVLNLMIGLLTPPVGLCTFIVSDIAKRPFECVVKATLPFMAILIAVLMLVTYFPDITLFLPRLLLR